MHYTRVRLGRADGNVVARFEQQKPAAVTHQLARDERAYNAAPYYHAIVYFAAFISHTIIILYFEPPVNSEFTSISAYFYARRSSRIV